MELLNKKKFFELAANGATFIPLVESWPADLETPLSTWLKISQSNKSKGVLLESVEGGETIGRWSVVAVDPVWSATVRGKKLQREWRNGISENFEGNPFEILRGWLSVYKSIPIDGLPPLGQLFGTWGYELINWIEPKVPIHDVESNDLPDATWMFMDKLLIFDQVKRFIIAVSYGDLTSNSVPEKAYEIALQGIQDFKKVMSEPMNGVNRLQWNPEKPNIKDISKNWSKVGFENAVLEAKRRIEKGDIFQLVLSQKFSTKVPHNPFDLYRSLRMVNPSPFMAFFDFGDWYLIGSSPEVMVKAEPSSKGVSVSLRPIAGTRPRGADSDQDHSLAEELLCDPKERAEHVMLVDLGRNDLGRVCKSGSVSVKELMVIEKYSHVMHIVSSVKGLLNERNDVWDLLMAAFPAGTVSGAPKIRAMQLINKLETQRRGPYSGVYGSMDLNGALNTAITIRTMVVTSGGTGKWKVEVQAGAGIVADSIPANEYQETINKARGMLSAVACLNSLNK